MEEEEEEVALDAPPRILLELPLEIDLVVDDDEEEDRFKSPLSLLDGGRGLSPLLGVIFVAIPPPPPLL